MNRHKTTGHIFKYIAWIFALALLAPAAQATDLELTTSNDIISGDDDLYTAEVGVRFSLSPRIGLALGERIFTDREAGYRFDESYVRLQGRLPELAGWQTEVELGALHVGEGVGGESLQNAVHRVVGSDEVDLEYRSQGRWFPALGLSGRKFLGHRSGAALFARGEIDTVPDFRSSLLAAVEAERPLNGQWAAHAELGLRADYVQTALLDDHVDGLAPAARLGVSYRRLSLAWSWNEYGTETGHVTIGYRLGVGRVTLGDGETDTWAAHR